MKLRGAEIKFIKLTKRNILDFIKYFYVRYMVFVTEQNRPIYKEYGRRDLISDHFIAKYNDRVLGCGRIRRENTTFIIGRVAVLKPYRNLGIGSFIVNNLVQALTGGKRSKDIVLGSRVNVKKFYEKLGFYSNGEEKTVFGKRYIQMKKRP